MLIPSNPCILPLYNTYDPGTSPGSAYQCIPGVVYLRSNPPSNHLCQLTPLCVICCQLAFEDTNVSGGGGGGGGDGRFRALVCCYIPSPLHFLVDARRSHC